MLCVACNQPVPLPRGAVLKRIALARRNHVSGRWSSASVLYSSQRTGMPMPWAAATSLPACPPATAQTSHICPTPVQPACQSIAHRALRPVVYRTTKTAGPNTGPSGRLAAPFVAWAYSR
jgi:hypothetical protein